MNLILLRLERLEKLFDNKALIKSKTPVENLLDSFSANTIDLNPKNIEICSILGFFVIGAIVGWSLLDRLWLIGGFIGALWSSLKVNSDTRGGVFARQIGASLAVFIRDLQEKYNAMVIFYRTGQLAYVSSKTWEQYDKYFGISTTIDTWKRQAFQRAIEFNSAISDQQFVLTDVWNTFLKAPEEIWKLDDKYGVTSSIYEFSNGIISFTIDVFDDIISRGRSRSSSKTSSSNSRMNKKSSSWSFWRNPMKKVPVNPWEGPFKSLQCYYRQSKNGRNAGLSSKMSLHSPFSRRNHGQSRLHSHSFNTILDSNQRKQDIFSHTAAGSNDMSNYVLTSVQASTSPASASRTIISRPLQIAARKPSSILPSSSSSLSWLNPSIDQEYTVMMSTKNPLQMFFKRLHYSQLIQFAIMLKFKLKYVIAGVISPMSQYPSKEEALRLWRTYSIRGLVREHVAHSLF